MMRVIARAWEGQDGRNKEEDLQQVRVVRCTNHGLL